MADVSFIGSAIDAAIDGIAALAKWIASLGEADRQRAIDRCRERHGTAVAAHLEMLVAGELAISEAQAAIDAERAQEE